MVFQLAYHAVSVKLSLLTGAPLSNSVIVLYEYRNKSYTAILVIFSLLRWVLFFNRLFRAEASKFETKKFDVKKPDTSLGGAVAIIFRYFDSLSRVSPV